MVGDLDGALRWVFSSYEARYRRSEGKFDRETRHPERIAAVWDRLGLRPPAENTCVVSGSKGKGTTARLIAWNLTRSGYRVGLVLTPEEISHLDRIRIDNRPIPENTFLELVRELAPSLDAVWQHAESDAYYLPPTAVFLTVAMAWFKREQVDRIVIEGGRGAKWDEIGQIEARVGVVANVLPEHLGRLGPNLGDIASDKLSLLANCREVLMPEGEAAQLERCGIRVPDALARVPAATRPATANYPAWYPRLAGLGCEAARTLGLVGEWVDFGTPAFAWLSKEGRIAVDGAVTPLCLDDRFLRESGLSSGTALLGLSSDKDCVGLVAALRACGFRNFAAVRLHSPVGHLDSDWLDAFPDIEVVGTLNVVAPDAAALHAMVCRVGARGPVFALGVQVFVRSLRCAFGQSLGEPGS